MKKTRVPLTLEMAAALSYAIKGRLLALELWGHGGDPFGLTSGGPDILKIARVGGEMVLCAKVLEDLDPDGPIQVTATNKLFDLIQNCENDAYLLIEHDAGGHPDDLALAQARLTMLKHTYEWINGYPETQVQAEEVPA